MRKKFQSISENRLKLRRCETRKGTYSSSTIRHCHLSFDKRQRTQLMRITARPPVYWGATTGQISRLGCAGWLTGNSIPKNVLFDNRLMLVLFYPVGLNQSRSKVLQGKVASSQQPVFQSGYFVSWYSEKSASLLPGTSFPFLSISAK